MLAILVLVFLLSWFVCGLCVFHLYLVVKNKTTNEQLRGLHEFGSVYSIGIIGNIRQICCVIPKSSVHIHHKSLYPTDECEEIQKRIVHYAPSRACLTKKESYDHEDVVNSLRTQYRTLFNEKTDNLCPEHHSLAADIKEIIDRSSSGKVGEIVNQGASGRLE